MREILNLRIVRLVLAVWLAWGCALGGEGGDVPPPPLPAPPAEEAPAPPSDEKKLRAEFLAKYTPAKPTERADFVDMLKGVREPESLRMLTGLLGDSMPTVRRNACRVMSETPDPEGYFVKFLIGALSDRNYSVRSAALDALSVAKLKAQAFKALFFALNQAIGEGEKQASYAMSLNAALSKLTGKQFGKPTDMKKLLQWWQEWSNENQKLLEAADETYLRKLKDGGKPAVEEPKPETIPPPAPEQKTGAAKPAAEKTKGKIEDE